MGKKISVFIISFVLLLTLLPFVNSPAQAATVYKGTFESITYDDKELQDGTVERTIKGVTLRNSSGKTTTFNVNNNTAYYINNTVTTIDGFKYGMELEATVNLRTVTKLVGKSDVEQGTIVKNSRELSGVVTKIDPNGLFIRVKLDSGTEKDYYLNNDTVYFKGRKSVDLSILFEGDRVKMRFSNANSSLVTELEINQVGTMIENLYKAQLNSVNVSGNRFTVSDSHPFTDWEFGIRGNDELKTYSFNSNTTIYVGNKKISKNQLRNYKYSDIYFLTVKQYSKEIVKKIIVLQNNERTYFDRIASVDASLKYLKLEEFGTIYYHAGTILVRNGRLVEPTSLTSEGSAFVLTDGITKNTYTHIVNVVNDGFLSPNLASHDLYFGQLSLIEGSHYLIEISDFTKLEQDGINRNHWKYQDEERMTLSYSNNTISTATVGNSGTVLATSLQTHKNKYGFFYVKDGHVQAAHLLGSNAMQPTNILTGRIATVNVTPGTQGAKGIDSTAQIKVENVSQWYNGAWLDTAQLNRIELSQVLIIKNGKRISVQELESSDRVVIFTDEDLNAKIVLVNE